MKNLPRSGLGFLMIIMTMVSGVAQSGNQEPTANKSIRDRLIGA